MTTAEIVTVILASLSLIVSLATAYLTLFARFKGVVLPRRRIFLVNRNSEYWLIFDCEFVNQGARPGLVEDIRVEMDNPETGLPFIFNPHFVRDQFSIYQEFRVEDYYLFTGISLDAKQKKELFVVFKPDRPDFEPPNGVIGLHTNYRNDTRSSKWVKSHVRMTFNFDENVSRQWSSSLGRPQQISAVEIVQSRH